VGIERAIECVGSFTSLKFTIELISFFKKKKKKKAKEFVVAMG
jgi:hypothetical protein